MREALHHRGPDDGGTWNSASDGASAPASPSSSPAAHALLGSRRLAILDLSPAGHQPMVDPESRLVIAYNGEIYNYAELTDELASHGAKFRSRGDTEVLLKAYATWGRDCLAHLNGMFAFAIWDPHKREVFCARDRFGEKPFYYYRGDDFLAFASEIKSLVAGRIFNPEPDPNAIYGYLANREMDSTAETLFKNVHSLPAAHALEYSAATGSLKIWKYWDIDPAKETHLPTDEDYALRFLELLTDSVRIRLRSDVPLGSSLSGGLDSSTVVGLIARLGAAQGQATFSARFADPRFDEGRYIEKVVAHAHAAAHEVYPDPTRVPDEIETLTWHQDHPFYSSSIYAQWCVMRLAREADVTVLLDGQGADETLAGYHEFFSAAYCQQLKDLKILQAASSVRRYTADHGTAALSLIFRSLLPAPIRSAATRLARPRAIPREFASRYSRPPARLRTDFRHSLQHSLYNSLTQTVLPQLLRYADRNSMAFSREVRLPFLDHRVVEFLFAIPAEQKIAGSTTKIVLRNAIRGVVPEEIRTRKDKLGFAPPEVSWLQGPLRPWITQIFASPQFKQREWTDSREVDKVWANFLAGRTGLHTSVWRWLSLEMWVRVCLAPRTELLHDNAPSTVPNATKMPAQSIAAT